MDAITEFAKMFKERNNPSLQGVGIGIVTDDPPDLAVTFNGFVLDASYLVVADHLVQKATASATTVGASGEHTHEVDYTLKAGDAVIVIPSLDNSRYFIVGKVG